jgi:hypothetical protein
MSSNVILRGFGDYEGETMAVFLAGLDCGDFPVIAGRITVPFGSAGGLLTERYLTQVSALKRDWGTNTVILDEWVVPCVVGYRYKSRGQRLRPASGAESGAANGPAFGKKRRNHMLAALLNSTAGISFGQDFERLKPANFRTPGGKAYTPTDLFTGIHVDNITAEADYDGMLAWEVEGPYSAQVAAIGGFLQTQDK